MRRTRTYAALTALSVVAATAGTAAALTATASATAPPTTAAAAAKQTAVTGCQLGTNGAPVKHVIYLQFDNVELERDNPNVPADLEQIPALLNFMKSNGTLLANHHTPLISHTADDILTSLTGVYGDRHGQPIANSYRFFTPPLKSIGYNILMVHNSRLNWRLLQFLIDAYRKAMVCSEQAAAEK